MLTICILVSSFIMESPYIIRIMSLMVMTTSHSALGRIKFDLAYLKQNKTKQNKTKHPEALKALHTSFLVLTAAQEERIGI